MTDAVTLVIPASTEHVQLARLVASGIAGRLAFDLDEIEDLRIAVDELCVLLLEHGASESLSLAYEVVDEATLLVRGTARVDAGTAPPEISLLTAQILSTVADAHDLGVDGDGTAYFTLRKTRQHA
ncbi:MAG TPA: hypothetical protein VFZ83_04225 [Acidimicrobiia bacterium]|nr:hypothetical protein [Acidimicrobiia bacterium]